jgi:hypothetical protein
MIKSELAAKQFVKHGKNSAAHIGGIKTSLHNLRLSFIIIFQAIIIQK